jgi:hypothetical protein
MEMKFDIVALARDAAESADGMEMEVVLAEFLNLLTEYFYYDDEVRHALEIVENLLHAGEYDEATAHSILYHVGWIASAIPSKRLPPVTRTRLENIKSNCPNYPEREDELACEPPPLGNATDDDAVPTEAAAEVEEGARQ